jgi:hypothetical protein
MSVAKVGKKEKKSNPIKDVAGAPREQKAQKSWSFFSRSQGSRAALAAAWLPVAASRKPATLVTPGWAVSACRRTAVHEIARGTFLQLEIQRE